VFLRSQCPGIGSAGAAQLRINSCGASPHNQASQATPKAARLLAALCKGAMRALLKLFVVMVPVVVYIQYVFYGKKQELREIAQPLHARCQTHLGCVTAPEGWRKESDYYMNGSMIYRSTKTGFTIHQHIATDTWLVAKGGLGVDLTVENIGEYR